MKINNFITRTITGSIFVILIVVSILVHPYFFYITFGLFTILSIHEFYSITNISGSSLISYFGIAISVLIFGLTSYISENPTLIFLYLFIIPLIFILFILELFLNKENPIQNIAIVLLGIIYIALPLSMLILIPKAGLINNLFYKGLIMGYFILIWTNDTFAYLIGVKFGKNRLFQRVSPKKSWEGSIGGLLFSIICSYVLSEFFIELTVYQWIGMAIIVVIFGSLGDLIESLFKRSLNIKDSGNLLPGHGGILDRLDAVFISAPFVFIYLFIIKTF